MKTASRKNIENKLNEGWTKFYAFIPTECVNGGCYEMFWLENGYYKYIIYADGLGKLVRCGECFKNKNNLSYGQE